VTADAPHASPPTVIVFAGPTIGADQLASAFEESGAVLIVDPPAARGDVARAVDRGADAIGVIDGFYEHQPSVHHKEILWAIEQGARVYGSSSMGAIRAAECAAFGMIGVGRIYEAFAAGDLDDDDVSIAHASAEDGYTPISEAMVNIRATLELAVSLAVVDEHTARLLDQVAKQRFYAEREWNGIETAAVQQGAPEVTVHGFRSWRVGHGTVDAKRRDAELLASRIVQDLGTGGPSPLVSFRTTVTAHFDRMLAEERSLGGSGSDALWRQPLLEELRLHPGLFERVAHEAVRRGFARHVGQRSGATPEQASIDAASDRLRQRLGLFEPDELHRWLDQHQLTFDDYTLMVERELFTHLGDQMVPSMDDHDLLDVVRLLGLAGRLGQRADAKVALLRGAGVEEAGGAGPTEVTVDEALEWFCSSRLREPVPEHAAAVEALAHRLGFTDTTGFLAALRREHHAIALGLDPDTP